MAHEFTDANFQQEVLQNDKVTLIDLWAEWCGPCRRVAPSIEELAREFAGRVAFGKCNTDENHRIAMELYISAIPAIMLFSHGRRVDQIIGAYPKEAIRERIVKRFGLD